MGEDTFPRVRFGVGEKPHPDYDLADWVLGRFPEEDVKTLGQLLQNILPICSLILAGNIDKAMSDYN